MKKSVVMRASSTCFIAAVALGLGLGSSPAHSSMVLAMDLAELAKRAETIVVAEVVSVASSWEPQQRTVVSRIDLSVAERWKGAAVRKMTVVQVGGEANGVVVTIHGAPTFTIGERAVLFLTGPATSAAVVGMGQGKRPLRFDARTRRWMVMPGDSSAAVRPDGAGGLTPVVDVEGEISLETARARVRKATAGRK